MNAISIISIHLYDLSCVVLFNFVNSLTFENQVQSVNYYPHSFTSLGARYAFAQKKQRLRCKSGDESCF